MTSPLDDGLRGARVLVTGAAGGIGAATAAAFAAAGARVAAADLPGRPAPEAMAAALEADLRDPAGCADLVGAAAGRLGGLDVVAHLAGVMRRRADLGEVTEEDWDVQHDVNLKSSFFLLRAAGELMTRQGGGGRLIAAASQGWWSGGYGGSAVYAATKGGLVSLCRGLARTYGPAGITVNTVAPGAIDTPMLTTDLSPGALDAIVAATPLGRVGAPEEVASAVLFLASARASFVTAATLNVSGGWLAY
ncbi:SDR family oxidoreductase [Actinacidiphila alni]|uniref:SDR family NAD(P)-dependent oxidoreductase n=1 Tax=Actinacidiphila alni TaxID=380248 RepID=UPI0033C99257